eukprot:TRINITY_DN6829_c0_g2_i1.p1 TRINITY_DN6829_c0_g2~~TRINITY_DN6829_c0_g2_i1.p1  ORF type:complete len:327 (-),score=62.97 TRINITY_DN6829_c0_g2_i1:1008-1988(-)
MTGRVAVVGGCNIDLVFTMERRPKVGETLMGKTFDKYLGGKGANQAVSCALIGAPTSMIGKVGDDDLGVTLVEGLKKANVDVSNISKSTTGQSTGLANIYVDEQGDNSIVVINGANNEVSEEDIAKASETISGASVLLSQLNLPIKATLAALKIAKTPPAKTLTILNAAPLGKPIPDELFPLVDILCTNEIETETISGLPVTSDDEIKAAAKKLKSMGVGKVVITIGSRGAAIVDETSDDVTLVPTRKVKPVDTTGAGDCFLGVLAMGLAQGDSLLTSVRRANLVASISVTRPGAQSSYPLKDDPELVSVLQDFKTNECKKNSSAL